MAFKFVDPDAKPEDIEGNVGVSDTFKIAVTARLKDEKKLEGQLQVQDKKDENIKIEETLADIAGTPGVFTKLNRKSLQAPPQEWNKFDAISEDKRVLMAESIYRNGLMQPIVVRAINKENTNFEILAGNTRNSIYDVLYDITGDPKYKTIEAKVYWYGQLTDTQAREIITDTNYIQRASLSSKDRAFCIHTKITMLKKRHGYGEGKQLLEKISNQMGLKKSSIYKWDKMVNLLPELYSLYDNGQLNLINASKIASWPENVQKRLLELKDVLTNNIVEKISVKDHDPIAAIHKVLDTSTAPVFHKTYKVTMKNTHVNLMLDNPDEDKTIVVLEIPKNKLENIKKRYEKYLYEEI